MKKLSSRAASFLAASLLALTAGSASAQVWNFDSNDQGWRVADFSGTADYTTAPTFTALTYNATGGKSGGYVSATDPSSGTFMFAAPTASLGNYSSYLGGKLSFSLETDQSVDWLADSVVVLRSAGFTIIGALSPQPGTSWTDYSFDLVASSFRYNNLSGGAVSTADFASVLSGITALYINAEYHNGVSETSGLDSVAFSRAQTVPPSAVPEPATYGMIGAAALLGLAVYRRRATR